jgi:polyferredoxin
MKKWSQTIKPVDLIRRATQIIAFLLIPGLFTSVFYGIKELYTALIEGRFTVITISSQIFMLLAVILSTVVLGRFFCGFFCSFGAMGDLIWFISKKTVKPKLRISETVDENLKLLKYGLLLFIVIALWTFHLVTINSTSNPWNIFGIYSSLSGFKHPGYLISIGGLLLFLIIIGSLFIERFFCSYLCPLGAIFALLSKLRFFNIKKSREACGSCRICSNQCSMGIPLN